MDLKTRPDWYGVPEGVGYVNRSSALYNRLVEHAVHTLRLSCLASEL